MLTCLKNCHNNELLFDPSNPAVGASEPERRDWVPSEFFHVLTEGIDPPSNTPCPRHIGFASRA